MPVNMVGTAVGESAYAVFAVNKTAMLQFLQSQPNRDPAHIKALAKLSFTAEKKGLGFLPVENFLG